MLDCLVFISLWVVLEGLHPASLLWHEVFQVETLATSLITWVNTLPSVSRRSENFAIPGSPSYIFPQ